MKKHDLIFIGTLFLIGLTALLGIRWYTRSQATGESFAKVFYKDQMILLIDLQTCDYVLYDTPYKDQVVVAFADQGLFYVPGTTTVNPDPEDDHIDLPRVTLKVNTAARSIEVVYQESPRDICELQGPSDSSLKPLVCLPNELVITVVTDQTRETFIPDGVIS